jgi:hypothetical protein
MEPLIIGCQTGNLVALETELAQNCVESILNNFTDGNIHDLPTYTNFVESRGGGGNADVFFTEELNM